jgi:hypothetical protein
VCGRQGYCLLGADGSARVVIKPGVTARRWSWWTVVRWHLLIDPFEFKFNNLNTNLTIFDRLRFKNFEKNKTSHLFYFMYHI